MLPTHFVCVPIWRRNPAKGEIEFLVIDSVSINPATGYPSEKHTKFPGGMNRFPGESVELTGKREVLEETHLSFNQYEKIWEYQASSDHTKYALLVNYDDCRGELRKDELEDNGDRMSPPYWESVSSLKFKLFRGHQPALLRAMEYLGLL